MLGIDLTYVRLKGNRYFSGVSLYALDTIRALLELRYGDEIALIVHPSDIKYYSELFPNVKLLSSPMFSYRVKRYVNENMQVYINDKIFKKAKINCVWYPYVNPETTLSRSINKICTVHDLIPLDRSVESSNRADYDKMLSRCQNIIAISEFVREDIERNFPQYKVYDVIYNPVNIRTLETEPISELVGRKFILDLNAYNKRKNPKTLILAFEKIINQVDFDLVFCGGEADYEYLQELEDLTVELEICDRVHFFLGVSQSERNWLLLSTLLLVSPTTSEGFGRTPIEAAICKKTVLTTKVDSLIEVTEGLLNYYDNPYDVDELADAILNLYENKINGEELEKIADKYREKYNPLRIAERYHNCAKRLGAFTE